MCISTCIGRGWWICLILYMSLLQDGLTALYFASQQNHLEVVKFLLESGAQVNKVQHCNVQTVQPSQYSRDSTDLKVSVSNPADTQVRTQKLYRYVPQFASASMIMRVYNINFNTTIVYWYRSLISRH